MPYYQENESYGYNPYNGPGKQHSKTVRVGPLELISSCNWTVSSMGNQERVALIWLAENGRREAQEHEEALRRHARTFEDFLEQESRESTASSSASPLARLD